MVSILDLIYERSASVVAQGKDVAAYRKKGFYPKQGGFGSYVMVKSSKATLFFEANGKKHSSSVNQLIREAYNISKVTENYAYRFFDDLKAGNVKLDYSEDTGLSLVK